MRIAFIWSKGGPSSWDGRNLESGIGGSEAMMILYAREFARMGHSVICISPGGSGVTDGVVWLPQATKVEGLDVVVSVRTPQPLRQFRDVPIRAILCNDQSCPDLPQAVQDRICNRIITISQHQTDRYQQLYPMIPDELFLTSSAGVDWHAYQNRNVERNPYRCLYTSTQERGLRYLVDMWPRIHALSGAELVVTGGYQLYGWSDEQAKQASGNIYERVSALPGATYAGILTRSEMQERQLSSSLLLYPSVYEEQCCIAALEAASAGMAIITSPIGALTERVLDSQSGYFVQGHPGMDEYQDMFMNLTFLLLENHTMAQEFGEKGRELAAPFDYRVLCKQWLEVFNAHK